LILGYGFSLPQNPDDTLALKLGIPEDTLTPAIRAALDKLPSSDDSASPLDRTWYIPRSGVLPSELFDIVRIILSPPGTAPEDDPELEMDVTGMLLEMVQGKLDRLNELLERNEEIAQGGLREGVWDMVQDYMQGEY
jgi:hypothetical protein